MEPNSLPVHQSGEVHQGRYLYTPSIPRGDPPCRGEVIGYHQIGQIIFLEHLGLVFFLLDDIGQWSLRDRMNTLHL